MPPPGPRGWGAATLASSTSKGANAAPPSAAPSPYVVVVSDKTHARWPTVVAALVEKHTAATVSAGPEGLDPQATAAALRRFHPRHVTFVAHWSECGREYVCNVHRTARSLDPSHPFSDVQWGVVTGHDEATARAMAAEAAPLAIRRVVSGSVEGVDLRAFHSGFAVSELDQGVGARKEAARTADGADAAAGIEVAVPPDATQLLREEIESPATDMIVTSGHARESEWNLGFRFPGGQFRPGPTGELRAFGVGQAIGPDAIHPDPVDVSTSVASNSNSTRASAETPADAAEAPEAAEAVQAIEAEGLARAEGTEVKATGKPKVYSAAGNCLMGHVNSEHCMALAWFRSCDVRQMVGYTVPTWFGFAGWGVHRYLWGNVGSLDFSSSYFANQQALELRLVQLTRTVETAQATLSGAPENPATEEADGTTSVAAAGAKQLLSEAVFELRGLNFDREATVFFGDPAWEARMVPTETESGAPFYTIDVSETPTAGGVQVEVRVTTLRDGCWTAVSADDKTTLPGRPPFAFRDPPGELGAAAVNVGMGGGSTVSLGEGLVVTPLFVLVPLEGPFGPGEIITRAVVLPNG